VHTSAKARLARTRIRIRIRIRDPNRHQNLIIFFIGPLPTFPGNFMQIRSEVLRKVKTDRQTDKQTGKQRRLHNLLGGGNNHIETL